MLRAKQTAIVNNRTGIPLKIKDFYLHRRPRGNFYGSVEFDIPPNTRQEIRADKFFKWFMIYLLQQQVHVISGDEVKLVVNMHVFLGNKGREVFLERQLDGGLYYVIVEPPPPKSIGHRIRHMLFGPEAGSGAAVVADGKKKHVNQDSGQLRTENEKLQVGSEATTNADEKKKHVNQDIGQTRNENEKLQAGSGATTNADEKEKHVNQDIGQLRTENERLRAGSGATTNTDEKKKPVNLESLLLQFKSVKLQEENMRFSRALSNEYSQKKYLYQEVSQLRTENEKLRADNMRFRKVLSNGQTPTRSIAHKIRDILSGCGAGSRITSTINVDGEMYEKEMGKQATISQLGRSQDEYSQLRRRIKKNLDGEDIYYINR